MLSAKIFTSNEDGLKAAYWCISDIYQLDLYLMIFLYIGHIHTQLGNMIIILIIVCPIIKLAIDTAINNCFNFYVNVRLIYDEAPTNIISWMICDVIILVNCSLYYLQ